MMLNGKREAFAHWTRSTGTGPGADGLVVVAVVTAIAIAVAIAIERADGPAGGGFRLWIQIFTPRRMTVRVLTITPNIHYRIHCTVMRLSHFSPT